MIGAVRNWQTCQRTLAQPTLSLSTGCGILWFFKPKSASLSGVWCKRSKRGKGARAPALTFVPGGS